MHGFTASLYALPPVPDASGHCHAPVHYVIEPFAFCQAPGACRPAAHGGYQFTARCSCGAHFDGAWNGPAWESCGWEVTESLATDSGRRV